MKAKLKPSKTHHGPQPWKRISSPPMFRRARILIYSLHKKGGRLKEKELEQSILELPVCSSICFNPYRAAVPFSFFTLSSSSSLLFGVQSLVQELEVQNCFNDSGSMLSV
ncbi:unnamed protein product [Prunus brigantina]